jgi:hypothetical protein
MILRIKYDPKKRINPIKANLSVPWAFLTFSGLPKEVK